jgi:hypothetical protein
MWKAQVVSAIKGAQLAKFIKSSAKALEEFLSPVKGDDDTKGAAQTLNLEYDDWVAKD